MSVKSGGRKFRKLLPPAQSIQFINNISQKALSPSHDSRSSTVIAFFLIVLGGTCSTIATIIHLKWLYWTGISILVLSVIFMFIQSSRLNRPCSLA